MKHSETQIQGKKESLYFQAWQPEDKPKAALLILHGLNDHSSRYAHVAEFMVNRGMVVYAYDQIGHGKSGGLRAYIESFDDWVDDLAQMVGLIHQEIGDTPLFVLGHSMGGAVVTKYLMTKPHSDVRGFILSSAALKTQDDMSPFIQKISGVLGKIIPKAELVALESKYISRDPEEVRKYDEDPLVPAVKIRARTGAEVIKATKYIQENMGRVDVPLLIFHGTEDKLTDPKGSQWLYERAISKDKTFNLLEGLYHETMNEPEKEQVMSDVASWIEARI
jgi:acylglycerol lipase